MYRSTVFIMITYALGSGILTGGAHAQAPPQDSEMEAVETTLLARHDGSVWGKGQVLPVEHLQAVVDEDDLARFFLQPAEDGYRWVRVDRGAYRVKEENGVIEEAVFGLPAN